MAFPNETQQENRHVVNPVLAFYELLSLVNLI